MHAWCQATRIAPAACCRPKSPVATPLGQGVCLHCLLRARVCVMRRRRRERERAGGILNESVSPYSRPISLRRPWPDEPAPPSFSEPRRLARRSRRLGIGLALTVRRAPRRAPWLYVGPEAHGFCTSNSPLPEPFFPSPAHQNHRNGQHPVTVRTEWRSEGKREEGRSSKTRQVEGKCK